MSIPGFTVFTAVTLMSDVGEIKRFSSAKKFCSYLRVSPKVKASNKTVHIGSLNRQSRTMSCSLLTQSVTHFAQAGEPMSQFYLRMRQGKSAGKARIALIRKILVGAYHMLKRDEIYCWSNAELYARKLGEYERQVTRARASRPEMAEEKIG